MREASFTPDMADEIDSLEDILKEIHRESGWTGVAAFIRQSTSRTITVSESHYLQRIIQKLLIPSNLWVSVVGLMFATGLNRLNIYKSQRDAAKQYGLTPAAINAAANEWLETLDLPRNEHFKSEAAVASYKKNGKENHWRSQCKPPTKA